MGMVRWDELLDLKEKWAGEKKTVVWTNGCFDVFHVGHLHCLEGAKRLGDVLVVGVNSDAAVRELKGQNRPIFPVAERMRLLAALRVTDYVVEFEGVTPEAALRELKPDVVVKGADYAPPSGKPMPEREVVESYGGSVAFVPLVPGRSTTSAIDDMRVVGSQDAAK
jgi:rfaE bifunctional protein nucleotidyltransferase chain/domain